MPLTPYAVTVTAPSGELQVGVDEATAERLKAAVLWALLEQTEAKSLPVEKEGVSATETTPAVDETTTPTVTPSPTLGGGQRHYGGRGVNPRSELQVELRREVGLRLGDTPETGFTTHKLTKAINRDRPSNKHISNSSVLVALGNLHREGALSRVRSGHNWLYWWLVRPDVAPRPEKHRDPFAATIEAGNGVIKGSV